MVFRLEVLHLWLSYQMDGFGDVMDVEGWDLCTKSQIRVVAGGNAIGTYVIRWTESACFSCAGGHSGPPLRRGFVVEQAFQIPSEVL